MVNPHQCLYQNWGNFNAFLTSADADKDFISFVFNLIELPSCLNIICYFVRSDVFFFFF